MSLDILPPSSLRVSSQADPLFPSARVIQLPLIYPCRTKLHLVGMNVQFPWNQKEGKQDTGYMKNDAAPITIVLNVRSQKRSSSLLKMFFPPF